MRAKRATERNKQHMPKTYSISLTFAALLTLGGCSTTETKAVDVTPAIRQSLDGANFKDVSIAQDRAKGVITLGGQVATDADKARAEEMAKLVAGTQVVANQIAVVGYPLDSGCPYILWWSTSRLSRISGEQSDHRLPAPRPLLAEPSGRKVCHGCWIAAG